MKKLLTSSIVFLLAFLWTASLALAAPSISSVSGTLTDKSSVSITGASFGTKSPAAPNKWDNFSGGVAGQDISNGWSKYRTSGNYPKYSTTHVRTNYRSSDMSVLNTLGSGSYNCSFIWVLQPSDPQAYYFTYWKYDVVTGIEDNYKPARLYGTGPDTYFLPDFFFNDYEPGAIP
jgi:hypothetical protein